MHNRVTLKILKSFILLNYIIESLCMITDTLINVLFSLLVFYMKGATVTLGCTQHYFLNSVSALSCVFAALWNERKSAFPQTGSRTPSHIPPPSSFTSWTPSATRMLMGVLARYQHTPVCGRWVYCAATLRCFSSCPHTSEIQYQYRSVTVT